MRNAYLKMTVATLLFGSYLVASKLILKEVPVFTATLVRLVSAAVVLGAYVRLRSPGRWVRPGWRDALLLGTQSGLGVFLFSIFAMTGAGMTGGIESGAILSTVPIAVSLIALTFLRESPSARRFLGIALSVAGAASISALAVRSPGTGGHGNALLGSLLLCCAVVCEAVFLTFGKFLSRPLAPERLSLVLALIGAALFVVPACLEDRGILHAGYSWQTWALMVYTGVAINGLAAVLMYASMDEVDTTVAAAFTAMTPVSGTVLSMAFLGEALRLHHVVGMGLVVSGVFIVATAANVRKPRPAARREVSTPRRRPAAARRAEAAPSPRHAGLVSLTAKDFS